MTSTRVEARSDLERLIDFRVAGFGAHAGERRPGRRRVGVMSGRAIVGNQFWQANAAARTPRWWCD